MHQCTVCTHKNCLVLSPSFVCLVLVSFHSHWTYAILVCLSRLIGFQTELGSWLLKVSQNWATQCAYDGPTVLLTSDHLISHGQKAIIMVGTFRKPKVWYFIRCAYPETLKVDILYSVCLTLLGANSHQSRGSRNRLSTQFLVISQFSFHFLILYFKEPMNRSILTAMRTPV